MRHQFELPEPDLHFLNALGLAWEAVREKSVNWVIIHDVRIPDGYTLRAVRLAIRLESGYPDTQLDMAYFFPRLQRLDGISIQATTQQNLLGDSWQRWSRHRTKANPWRPGLDSLETHFILIQHWLEREFNQRKP